MNQESQGQLWCTVRGTWNLKLIEISTWYGHERQ